MFGSLNISHSDSFKKITFALQFLIMKKTGILYLFCLCFYLVNAQEEPKSLLPEANINLQKDSLQFLKNKRDKNIPLDSIKNMYGGRYVDYQKISYAFDTIQIDTTLHIDKYFRHNFTQKDDFEWAPFPNQGQTFVKLSHQFVHNDILPVFGATAKLFDYLSIEDITYYHVPTPTTILFYNSGMDGQMLNSTFTTNFSKFTNFSVGYKGLRSIGNYQRARSSHINFRTTFSYYNPAKRYQFRTHFISQKLDNLENGGLTATSVKEFKDDNPDFQSRGRVNVNLYDARSFLKSDRFYYEHELRLTNTKDSLQQNLTNLKVGHHFSFEASKYQFSSTDTDYFDNNEALFGERLEDYTKDKTELRTIQNQVYLKFNSPWIFGNFKVFGAVNSINQAYDAVKTLETENIPNERNINFTSIGGSWNGKYKGVFINGYAQQVINGENLNSNLHINAGFQLKNNVSAKAGLQIKTQTPNLNYTLNQSNFTNLNWNQNFDSEAYRTIYGSIGTKWLKADLFLHQIENYAYFDATSRANQYSQIIDYLKLKVQSELQLGHFHLNNTLLYQNVAQGKEVFRVPEFVTRNTLYYQDYFFKGDPLFAQIGISFKYYTNYYANSFNPVLNEFYLQNSSQVGNYPSFDVFVNGEVRRTRIYFKVENVTASITGRNYFVTPNQPARDLIMRLGVVWNFWN